MCGRDLRGKGVGGNLRDSYHSDLSSQLKDIMCSVNNIIKGEYKALNITTGVLDVVHSC